MRTEDQPSFMAELWADSIIEAFEKTLILSSMFPEQYNEWRGVPWWDRVQCLSCNHVGVTVFNTERFQDMNATIEVNRVGCNGCSLVGDFGYDGKGFRKITDFEEWMEVTNA